MTAQTYTSRLSTHLTPIHRTRLAQEPLAPVAVSASATATHSMQRRTSAPMKLASMNPAQTQGTVLLESQQCLHWLLSKRHGGNRSHRNEASAQVSALACKIPPRLTVFHQQHQAAALSAPSASPSKAGQIATAVTAAVPQVRAGSSAARIVRHWSAGRLQASRLGCLRRQQRRLQPPALPGRTLLHLGSVQLQQLSRRKPAQGACCWTQCRPTQGAAAAAARRVPE